MTFATETSLYIFVERRTGGVRLRSITCAKRFQLSVWSKTGKRCRTMLAISIQWNIDRPRQRLLRLCLTLQIVENLYENCSCSVPRI